MAGFVEPQPGGINGGQKCPVAHLGGAPSQELFDLLDAEDFRSAGLRPPSDQQTLQLLDRPMQDQRVEGSQGVDVLMNTAGPKLSVVQMKLIVFELVVANPIRGSVIVTSQVIDPVNVGFDGSLGTTAQRQLADQ